MFSASNPSAVWIGKADNVVGDMASGRKPGRGIPNVKVAILDTGVSPHHPFTKKVQDPRDRRNKDRYKDFVPKTGEQPDDNNTSHGTRALDLVLRMYEDADVYVARVFETDLSKPERDAYRMGEVRRPWYRTHGNVLPPDALTFLGDQMGDMEQSRHHHHLCGVHGIPSDFARSYHGGECGGYPHLRSRRQLGQCEWNRAPSSDERRRLLHLCIRWPQQGDCATLQPKAEKRRPELCFPRQTRRI